MMQRGEFLSHEPSTFTFQTSFLCPTRRETTSGRITGFQNFTRVHKYRSIPYEKKIFESIACSSIANECIFRFHVLHIHWKIKNFRLRVFIKKTLAQILWKLPELQQQTIEYQRLWKIKIESALQLIPQIVKPREGHTSSNSINIIESRSSSRTMRKRRRNKKLVRFASHLFRPFFLVDRGDFWPRTGSSRGTSRVRGSGKYNAVSTARETSTNGGAEIAS